MGSANAAGWVAGAVRLRVFATGEGSGALSAHTTSPTMDAAITSTTAATMMRAR
ncbi:hypothetical protein [Microbacterium lacticum]|uniref:hypothetical protein n=1 Tax=Microbacterium lacticum TaxID=33885 RepID=UPI001F56124D|nr:hypothetical protein [Microbacterium lacticum]